MELRGSFVDCCELIPRHGLSNLQQEMPSFYSKGALQKSPCLNGWTLKYSQMISPITVLMMPWWYGWMCNFFFFFRIAFQCQHHWMLWYLTKPFSIFNGLSDTVSKPEIDSSSACIIQKRDFDQGRFDGDCNLLYARCVAATVWIVKRKQNRPIDLLHLLWESLIILRSSQAHP